MVRFMYLDFQFTSVIRNNISADSSIMDDIESGIDPIPKKHMFYFDVYQVI